MIYTGHIITVYIIYEYSSIIYAFAYILHI